MLVMLQSDNDPAGRRKLMVYGVAFLTVIAILIGLSIAVFNKTFQQVTMVTLHADRAGLQMAKYGDIRVNGVLVGQVRSISQTKDRAEIQLGLQPEAADDIPANVEAHIMPTTLFGQKYVALQAPDDPAEESLQDGDVIPEDRVVTATELQGVLANLFPLLRSLRPQDLSTTLTALATALNGRGEQLGQTFEDLDAYLTDMNVHLPTLREDLRLLADVSEAYQVAAPDIITLLDNGTGISRTVVEKKDEIASLFVDVTGLADTTSRVLADNERNLIRFAELSRPAVALLAKYAPGYPCLIKGFEAYRPRLSKIFEPGTILQAIEIGSQRRAYDHRDKPVYADKRGPRCYGLPNNPIRPWRPVDLANGTKLDAGSGQFIDPEFQRPPQSSSGSSPLGSLLGRRASNSYSGTPQEQHVVNAVLARRSGRSADSYSSLATLLYGPVIRGSAVTL